MPKAETKLNSEPVKKKDWNSIKEKLDSEEQMSIFVPLLPGEPKNTLEPISTITDIKGKQETYVINVPKGKLVTLPKSLAMRLMEKYKIETEAGQEFRLDRNKNVQEALS